jgi:hypothetical protein
MYLRIDVSSQYASLGGRCLLSCRPAGCECLRCRPYLFATQKQRVISVQWKLLFHLSICRRPCHWLYIVRYRDAWLSVLPLPAILSVPYFQLFKPRDTMPCDFADLHHHIPAAGLCNTKRRTVSECSPTGHIGRRSTVACTSAQRRHVLTWFGSV